MIWNRLFNLDLKRRYLLKKAPPGPLREYLSVPFPASKTPYQDVDYLCIDMETTGLDPKSREILSIGFAPIDHNTIHLSESIHRFVKPTKPLPEDSVVIHAITDDRSQMGEKLKDVLPGLLEQITGRVLIAHYYNIEFNFLNAACKAIYGCPIVIPMVDTLLEEQRLLKRRNKVAQGGELRLDKCRERYHLPRYKAHDALVDAIACGELFLAQTADRTVSGNSKLTIGDLVI